VFTKARLFGGRV